MAKKIMLNMGAFLCDLTRNMRAFFSKTLTPNMGAFSGENVTHNMGAFCGKSSSHNIQWEPFAG